MLEFMIGRAGCGKTAACLSEIKAKMLENPMGPALILLLPEHMTYKTERQLATMMEEQGNGFFRSYVFGFRRFARQVLIETGGVVKPRITEIGKQLMLRRILEKHEGDLKFFYRAAHQRGFTDALSGMVDEFKSYGVTTGLLEELLSGEGDNSAHMSANSRLKDKLHDLSLVYGEYSKAMEGRYNDGEDVLSSLVEKLPSAAIMKNAEVWIDGFVFFNPQERNIITAMLELGADVHVTLCMDPANKVENERETGLFHRQYETMCILKKIADSMGISYSIRAFGMDGKISRFKNTALQAVEKRLFHYPLRAAKDIDAQDKIQITEAATIRLEVEAVAADMVRLCREKGYKWRDIGVLLRNEEAYGPVIDNVFKDFEVPCFSNQKRLGTHHPLASLVCAAFEAIRGWRYEAVFRCFRTGFFPVTRDQLDKLENYVLEYGIKGSHWTKEAPWVFYSGLSESPEIQAKMEEKLADINQIRQLAATPLLKFSQSVKAAETVTGLVQAAYELLTDLQVPEQLDSMAREAENAGRLDEPRIHSQIWDGIMELFDQLVETVGDESIKKDGLNRKEFEEILTSGIEALAVSIVPPGIDFVNISNFDQNSLDGLRAIYILGADDSCMPKKHNTQGLLTDADRNYLQEKGMLELAPGSDTGSLGENYQLYKGFTQPSEYMWVSYSLADAEGGGLTPAPVVVKLRQLLEAPFLHINPESMDRDDELQLAGGRQAMSSLAIALRGERDYGKMKPFWNDVYNWARQRDELKPVLKMVRKGLFAKAPQEVLPQEIAAALYTKKNHLRGSVTRFERFAKCPFSFFAQYGLNLKERKIFSFAHLDKGNLMHDIMCCFGERLKKDGISWREVTDDQCKSLCGEVITEILSSPKHRILLSNAQFNYMAERLKKTAETSIAKLLELARESDFYPEAFERSFGFGPGDMPPLVYSLEGDGLPKGKYDLEITGKIDRIDLSSDGQYFMIIDYKTGSAAINLLEVYFGIKLQLLTYLLVAKNLLAKTQGHQVLPAGMLYFFLKNPLISVKKKISDKELEKEVQKVFEMPGWVLADPEVIPKIDNASNFVKVKLKNGELDTAATNLKKVKTMDEFNILMDYVEYKLQKTGKEILSGIIDASPQEDRNGSSCTYCQFRAFCGYDSKLPGYRTRLQPDYNPKDDVEIMEKMAECSKEV